MVIPRPEPSTGHEISAPRQRPLNEALSSADDHEGVAGTGPLVSICMPVYNGERHIDQSLACACAQTYRNIEILVVDDCSTDNTVEIVERWRRRDSRIRLERNVNNLGVTRNWNRAVELATGEWVKFLFHDDLIDASFVEVLLGRAKEGWKAVACDRQIIFEDVTEAVVTEWQEGAFNIHLAKVRPDRLDLSPADVAELAIDYPCLNFIGEPTVTLLHRSLFQELGGFNTDFAQLPDLEYWLRIGLASGFCYVASTLASFRVHPKSATATNNASDSFGPHSIDPLILVHECLYSPDFACWRSVARKRHRLLRSRLWLRYRALRAHTRATLDILDGSSPDTALQRLAAWQRAASKYPKLRGRSHLLVPMAARLVQWRCRHGRARARTASQ